MPDGIELSTDDPIKVAEQRVFDGKVVNVELRAAKKTLNIRKNHKRKEVGELTLALLLLSSFNVACMHSTIAL